VNNAGLTPQEALRAATSLNARVFGLHDRGLLVEGRRADMVLVEGNPIQNINDTLNLRGIWRDGHRLAA